MADKRADRVRKRMVATISDYQNLFNSDLGRRVIWDLMKSTSFMEPSHTVGDSYTTAFKEGKRSVMLHILQKLKTDPNKVQKYIEMGVQQDEELFSDYE